MDCSLIKKATDSLRSYVSALTNAFSDTTSEFSVILPSTQFAQTLYSKIDRCPDNSVINRISSIQAYLTRIRNRTSIVSTLTTGQALVIGSNDFNSSLLSLCRNIILQNEIELRSRSENFAIKERSLLHLVYTKEKQRQYCENQLKCLEDNIIKTIINLAAEKETDLIFENEKMKRQLQFLKDNYNNLESQMRKEMDMEYKSTIDSLQRDLVKLQSNFQIYKDEVNSALLQEITINSGEMLKKMKAKMEESQMKVQQSITQIKNTSYGPWERNKKQPPTIIRLDEAMIDRQEQYIKEITKLKNQYRKVHSFYIMRMLYLESKHKKEIEAFQQHLSCNSQLLQKLTLEEKSNVAIKKELMQVHETMVIWEERVNGIIAQLKEKDEQTLQLKKSQAKAMKERDMLSGKVDQYKYLESLDIPKMINTLKVKSAKLCKLEEVIKNAEKATKESQSMIDQKQREYEIKVNKEKEKSKTAYEKLLYFENMMNEGGVEDESAEGKKWITKCQSLFSICKQVMTENAALKKEVDRLRGTQKCNN